MELLAISSTILKIIIVIALIGVMIMVLLGINYTLLVRSRQLADDNSKKLRDEVAHSDRVISPESVFHDFLARDLRKHRDKKINDNNLNSSIR